VHKAPVGFLHQRHGVLRGELAAGALQLQRALHHGGLDGQRVVGHAGKLVGMGRAFGLAAKVHRAGHAQVGQQGLVLRGEARQVVGAKEPPPLHLLPAMAGVAAQVAEIGDASKRQGAGRKTGGRRVVVWLLQWHGGGAGLGKACEHAMTQLSPCG